MAQYIINFTFDIGHGIDIAHDRDLKDFLAAIGDDNKHELMIKVKKPLLEE